ncbi:MAG: helix-turn-helix transcriptional regulator [Lachnospiraceae bacterium]|nr:helix-turn-helix transcriptional regulator [Lachnospiraceae bacterium]
MLTRSDGIKEKQIIEELIKEDAELRRQHELFEAEMAFKQELIDARKSQSLTQKDISRMTGLSQQAVSRMERGASGTIETIIRYLDSLGYSLAIKKKA